MNYRVPSSKRADAVTNRTRLLETALEVFAQSGLDLEVTDIAERARVGMGTLYRHFGNREAFLRAIITAVVEETLTQIQRAIQPHANDPRAALLALVSAGLQVQYQYQSVFAVVRDPRLARLFDPEQREMMRGQFLDQAKSVVAQGIQAGVFRKNLDLDLVAATIFGSLSGVFENLGKRTPSAQLEQQLFQLLWTMVAQELA